MTTTEQEFPIGAPVLIAGVIVGRSEFQEGPSAYCVEFDRKGKPHREWFLACDLDEDGTND